MVLIVIGAIAVFVPQVRLFKARQREEAVLRDEIRQEEEKVKEL